MLSGHTDTPTSITLSPNGSFILSPSLSSQTIIHDVRPFSPSPTRIHRVLAGAPAGFENTLLKGAWSKDDGGQRVAVGGADRTVTIWDVESSKILYKVQFYTLTLIQRLTSAYQLPGHKGTVTSVDFHPKEPVSESAVPSHHFSFANLWFVSPHRWKGRYHACWRNRTGHLSLNNGPCLGCVIQETFVLCPHWLESYGTLWARNYRENNYTNNELRNSGKIEARDDLGGLLHVPHVSTPTDRVSVLIRTGYLDPIR